jgi:alkylation response protein AidB-like acyl-CoA dehydrogenase
VLGAFSADKEIGAAASMIKVRRSEVQQMISEIGVHAAGYYANPFNLAALKNGWNEEPVGADYFNPLVPNYMFLRAASIYSGSNEIQRNIITKATLGL